MSSFATSGSETCDGLLVDAMVSLLAPQFVSASAGGRCLFLIELLIDLPSAEIDTLDEEGAAEQIDDEA